jgi:hypothetical protein
VFLARARIAERGYPCADGLSREAAGTLGRRCPTAG